MQKKKRKIPDNFATIAKFFLGGCGLFCLGFLAAQLDTVKHAQKAMAAVDIGEEMKSYASDPLDKEISVWKSVPHALDGGAVLIGAEYTKSLALILVDEDGHVLHRWTAENRIFNPETQDWWKIPTQPESFSIHDAALLPGGDVVFIQTLMDVNNFRGQRLARMDKNSHVLWQVPGDYHHFIHIANDRIYTMSSRRVQSLPEVGPALAGVSYLEDWIEVFTMDGNKADSWSVIEAFAHSPYRNWLTTFELDPDMGGVQRVDMPDGRVLYDLFHMNSIQYLDAAKAKALPNAQAGDLLLSFRGSSVIAVFRPETRQIVWAGRGPWRHQHDVQVGDDGKLYIYDNEGKKVVTTYDGRKPLEEKQTRLISYNAFTGETQEIYGGLNLYSAYLGYYHPLDHGNWLIDTPQHASIIVVSPQKEILWKLRTVPSGSMGSVPYRKQISAVHYYPASDLGFLKNTAASPAH